MAMGKNKIKIKVNDENYSKRRSIVEVDHWAFLEEIEAPMWADLTLELNMTAHDNGDAWFNTSHTFHRLSARQLRSSFAHPDVGNDFVNFKLQGAGSPKLPSSVSKSRGKDYTSKPRKNNNAISASKNHPVNDLGNKISRFDKDLHLPGESVDCKAKVIPESQTEVTDSITSGICNDSRLTSGSINSLNSQSACISGASTTSTITTVSQSQDIKRADVSTGGLLNALRTNLRRSCATKPALRVEVCDDSNKELKGGNSSSGKSSVGSSSIGNNGKFSRSVIPTKTDHPQEVKRVTKPNMKTRSLKSVMGKSGLENVVRPMNRKVTDYKASERPVKKMVGGLKQKELRNSNVREVGKSVNTVKGKGKGKDEKLVEVSDKNRACYRSRIEGRGGFMAVKSKVVVSENVANGTKGENVKRVALSRVSSGNCNMPVVRMSDQKRTTKLTENKGSVAPVGSKVNRTGRLVGTKVSSDVRVYHR